MSDIRSAYGSVASQTITNANIASSATAGWKGAAIDFDTAKVLDALVQIKLAAVNTAPANSKAIFLYIASLIDTGGTDYTSTGDGTIDGSEGTVTFPDITTLAIPLPLLGTVPYPVQNKTLVSRAFSIRAVFGFLPQKVAPAMINHSGMTLSVSWLKVIPVYKTVA